MKKSKLIYLAATMLLTATFIDAQTGKTVTGTVTDPVGAVLADATVTLSSTAGSPVLHAATDADGRFEFVMVGSGRYWIEAQAPGVQSARVALEVGSQPVPALRIQLQLPAVHEVVNVTASAGAAAVPPADQNPDSVTVDQGQLQALPIEGDDPLTIPSLFIEPAAVGAQGATIIVDGVETSSLDLPQASISEIHVNQNPYSAEFSRPGSSRIEVTTREGSHHHYRGLAALLERNSALDARNAFATVNPPLQRAVGDAELSGPIFRHATFFLSGRYFSNNQTAVVNAQVPSGLLTENFSTPERDAYAFGRLDFDLKPTAKLTFAYKFKDKSKQDRNVGGLNLPAAAFDFTDRQNEVKLAHTAILSDRLMNDARFSFTDEPQATDSVSNDPGLTVLGAFTGGSSQIFLQQRERSASLQDTVSYVVGRHEMRWGAGARLRFFDGANASNFGGAYQFSSLNAFEAGNPFLYSLNVGNPNFNYSQDEYFGFFTDEFRVGPHVSMFYGARYEAQTHLPQYHDVAPRLALAYAPGSARTVFRAGAGVFYDRQPDYFVQQSLLYSGQQIRQVLVTNPSYPVAFPPLAPPPLLPPSVVRIAPNIQAPYVMQANVGVEHKFGGRGVLTADFTTLRGVHLYRTRNLNAPLPSTGLVPNPNFVNIDQFEASGQSRSNSASISYSASFSSRLSVFTQYTWSHSTDDTSGYLFLPANNYNLRPEYGRSDFDRRHRFKLLGTYELPHGVDAGLVVNLSSGIPYNITTGMDNNHDTVANDRPPGVGRNTGLGPGYADVDLHLGKNFRFRADNPKPKLEIGVDAFNVFNTVNFMDYVGVLNSPYFGHAVGAFPAREIQFSLRVKF